MHHLVPYAQQHAFHRQLVLFRRGGIEQLLQAAVQLAGAQLPFAAGAEHLQAVEHGIAVGVGQAAGAQVEHRAGHALGAGLPQEEEIPLLIGQLGLLAADDAVGVQDDMALLAPGGTPRSTAPPGARRCR